MYVPYEAMPAHSRVWIYQSDKPLSNIAQLEQEARLFVENWTSHNQTLKAWAGVLHQRFIVLMVDESAQGATGCSLDKSVAFIKSLEQALDVDFFNRWNFAYQQEASVEVLDKDTFAAEYKAGTIHDKTLVFNNLVKNKAEMEKGWKVPLGESWHKNFV